MASVALPVHGVGEPRPATGTISAMFEHAVRSLPDAAAVRQAGTLLTYRELGRAASALGKRFAEQATARDVVALVLPNSIEFYVTYFGALRARMVPALLNPLYPSPQLEPLLREVMPRVVVCGPATREMILGLAERLGITCVICFGHDVTVTELAAEPEVLVESEESDPKDVGAILFSGGTTGVPKAVEHTHERLVIAVRCVEYNWPTRACGEVWLPIAPFTHIYGFLQGVLSPISARAEVVIPERFKPENVVELMIEHRVTVFGGGPPAIYAGVLAAANLPGADLSALRVCPAGGAPMPVELLERWRDRAGLEIHEGYGMTEMAPISGTTALSGVRPGSVGPPIPCNEVQVVDLETGSQVLPAGERGEIRVRGPHMMSGYRNRPKETAEVIRDGFIYTGDIGHLDPDGFLFITDRKKDVVLVKGFNVFPREIEEVLHTHPKVAAVGVVGVPDQRSGERLVAYVVPHEGKVLAETEIAAYAAERLVGYKCPGVIRVVEALPMTGVQKLDRVALRGMANAERREVG